MIDDAGRWHPVRPVAIVPRPAGLFWARIPDRHTLDGLRYAVGPLCTNPEHPVYQGVRPPHDTMPGCQGNEKARQFYVCSVCAPPPGDDR